MHLATLNKTEEFLKVRQAWDELCAAAPGRVSAFASFEWYESWLRHYGADARLEIVLLWEGERLLGAAPLMLREVRVHGVPARALCFIGNSQSLHNDFIVRPGFEGHFLRELLGQLFRRASEWELMLLRHLPVTSELYRALTARLDETGRTWRQHKTSIDSPYLVPEGGWDRYLAGRTTRTRKSLRNIVNTMHRAGEVSVRQVRSAAGFLEVADQVFEVARRSWSEQEADSLGSPANERFYRDLSLACAPRGWLSLWTLSLDGRMIAVEYHLRAFGKEHALRGHYLPEFAHLSPGTYLELQILKRIFEEEDRVEAYDFCGSFEPYKRKWTDSSVPHVDLEVFGASPRARLIALNETRLVPLLRGALPQGFWNNRLFRMCGINTRRMEMK